MALFTDSFEEVNGVGTVCQQFAAFARRRELPYCCVHASRRTGTSHQGSMFEITLKRSLASFPLDHDLYCDPLLSRYRNWVIRQLGEFRPDLVHIVGPGDLGVLGFWVAHCLGIPLVASWHTNVHEYASRRLLTSLSWLPAGLRERISASAEHHVLRACMAFYRLAHFSMAPNETMVKLLNERTGRPSYLMSHGVDLDLFSPCRKKVENSSFCIGYVGRLTPEKNVRWFAELEATLAAAGQRDFRLLLVGDGSERAWLQRNLRHAELPGILRGDRLADAFARMDVFVFPSRTDTFGLVILEAMASGVPVVVSPETGARVELPHGRAGFLVEDFAESVLTLMKSKQLRESMGCEARRFACSRTWDSVFEEVYRTYDAGLSTGDVRSRLPAYMTR